jgi:hypothetical protein
MIDVATQLASAIKLWFRTLNQAIRSLGWLNVGVSRILLACANLLLNSGTLFNCDSCRYLHGYLHGYPYGDPFG